MKTIRILRTLKIFPAFLLFLAFFSQSLLAMNKKASEGGYKLPQYEKFTLENGLTVYLMEQHEVPLVYLSLATPGGSIHDGEKAGLAFFTAEALHFGTKSYSKDQIEETFDFYGASFSSSAANESARINASFASKDRDKILPVIKEMIVNPVFDKTEFEKRKQRALLELKQAKESPRRVIKGYFDRFLYGNNPYGSPVAGTVTSVSTIALDDLQNFYDKNYIPNGSAIALVGDFKASEMKSYITSLFSGWKRRDIPSAETITPEGKLNSSRILLVNKDDATETTFLIGSYGIKQSNPDYVAVQVINTILGGRFTSWLNDELRVNSGLTYGARSDFSALKETGTFTISTYTGTATTVDAIDIALKVLKRLHEKGIDEKTLTSAKNYLKGQFPPKYETAGALSQLLVNMFTYNFNESFINDFEKNVDSLTLDKAKEIIAKYFPENNLQFVLIGKASEIKEKVAKYGQMTTVDIKDDSF